MIVHRVKASELMREYTLRFEVVGLKSLKARIWLGGKIISFGAWIIGCGIEFKE